MRVHCHRAAPTVARVAPGVAPPRRLASPGFHVVHMTVWTIMARADAAPASGIQTTDTPLS